MSIHIIIQLHRYYNIILSITYIIMSIYDILLSIYIIIIQLLHRYYNIMLPTLLWIYMWYIMNIHIQLLHRYYTIYCLYDYEHIYYILWSAYGDNYTIITQVSYYNITYYLYYYKDTYYTFFMSIYIIIQLLQKFYSIILYK